MTLIPHTKEKEMLLQSVAFLTWSRTPLWWDVCSLLPHSLIPLRSLWWCLRFRFCLRTGLYKFKKGIIMQEYVGFNF